MLDFHPRAIFDSFESLCNSMNDQMYPCPIYLGPCYFYLDTINRTGIPHFLCPYDI